MYITILIIGGKALWWRTIQFLMQHMQYFLFLINSYLSEVLSSPMLKKMSYRISLGSTLIVFWLNLQICHSFCFLEKTNFEILAGAHSDWSLFNNSFCSPLHWVTPMKCRPYPSRYLTSSWSVQIISWLTTPIYWNKTLEYFIFDTSSSG